MPLLMRKLKLLLRPSLTILAVLLLSQCQSTSRDQDLKVTGGRAIDEATYPAVVNIIVGNSACSATFVSDSTLVTAAHCVDNPNQRVYVRKYNAYSTRIFRHPGWQGQRTNHDLAVVVFPSGTSPHSRGIAKEAPANGSEITIVGYGKFNHFDDRSGGQKRVGTNVLRQRFNGILQFYGRTGPDATGFGDGLNSASSNGDSGGPMFVNEALVGVTSSGSVLSGEKFSYYVDLNFPRNREFLLDTTQQGANIPSLTNPDGDSPDGGGTVIFGPDPDDDTPDQPDTPVDPGTDPPPNNDPLARADRDLFVALGDVEQSDQAYRLFVGTTSSAHEVRVCLAAGLSLCPDGSDGLNVLNEASLNIGGRPIFVDELGVAVDATTKIAVAAYDQQGDLISAQAFGFAPAD